jgi:SAM-dependent methyltransferase
MHIEAYRFLQEATEGLDLTGALVLEIGSRNVNGTPRPLFDGCALYLGIDPRAGSGVDHYVRAADYDGHQNFDYVVTAETMEHADPREIVNCAWRALKPGGLFILTAATEGREVHSNDGVLGMFEGEYYGNVSREQLEQLLAEWDVVRLEVDEAHHDIYAVARKPDLPPTGIRVPTLPLEEGIL